MKNQTKLQRGGFVLAAGLLVMSAGLSARAQSQPNQVEPSQAQTQTPANQTTPVSFRSAAQGYPEKQFRKTSSR